VVMYDDERTKREGKDTEGNEERAKGRLMTWGRPDAFQQQYDFQPSLSYIKGEFQEKSERLNNEKRRLYRQEVEKMLNIYFPLV